MSAPQQEQESQPPSQIPMDPTSVPPPPPPPPSASSFAPPAPASHPPPPASESIKHVHPPTPPPSLPSIDQLAPPPPPASASELPPAPIVPLPTHVVQAAPAFERTDSANSLAVQPPTPQTATPAPPSQPAPPPATAELPRVNGEHGGLGTGAHGEGQAQSAVDVLADVAMGEAAMDLAGFAAGAGSADVKEQGVETAVVPPPQASPPLKRSFEESTDAAQSETNGYFSGTAVNGQADTEAGAAAESRDAKRPRVEDGVASHQVRSIPSSPVCGLPLSASQTSLPAVSVDHAAPTESPAPVSQQQQQHLPPAPSPSVPPPPPAALDASYTSASGHSAPATPLPPASTAPTMSPSDLHQFPAVQQQHQASASPAPQSVAYPSTTAFSESPAPAAVQQPSPYPSAQESSPHPGPSTSAADPAPIASTSQHSASPFPPPVDQSQQAEQAQSDQPPEPEPLAVMTKEQQKHAINLVRNLKRNKNASPFLKPVDHIALHIPDYYKIITQPMDLGSIEARLQATGKAMTNVHKVGRIYGLDYSYGTQPGWEGQVPEGFEPKGYRTVHEFKEDLDKIWNNCFRYNGPREKNPVSSMAGLMMDAAEKSYRGMPFAPTVSPYPPRHVSPEVKREPRPAPDFVPTIRRDDTSSRPKREIHAPTKDLPYLDSADPSLGQHQYHTQQSHMMQHAAPVKNRNGRSKNGPQEQLRFCKEVIKELFKKTHEAYAYPFYLPVDINAYPTYTQYVSRPMDLSTIRSKLEHNQYPLPPYDAFEADVRQIFENCFAFNPAGTVVHGWGRQLEAIFEVKWSERPPEDADDFSDDDGLNVMEQQLQMLAANIEQMRQNKKAAKEAKRYAQQQHQARPIPPPMPMSMPKPQKKASTPLAYNPYMPPRAPAPKKSRPSGGGGGGGSNNKKKKRRDDDSDDYYEDDGGAYYGGSGHGGGGGGGGGHRRQGPMTIDEEYVDFEMKRELAVKIVTFEGEKLEEAINIIRRGRPDLLGAANQEVELDIDTLDQRTLVALYRYVCPGAPVPVRQIEAPKPAKQQTSNKAPRNQRKNLDEEKEAERIELMERQLLAFEKSPAEAAVGASAVAATPQAHVTGEEGGDGGGDQASSDSSDEASSDSDSDED
ncbi:uncharacterized protein JCM15063_004892 [Sporobolomyces koalae]|uniref:uncharacterized protein n=1 Tax=Sporobolomyces koalae TaxID=500713 RepID=UPI00317A0A35